VNRRAHTGDDGSFARDAGTQTGKAVIVIVVVVIIGYLVLHRSPTSNVATSTTHHVTTTASATSTTSTTVALIPPSQVKLQVLNGVLVGPLASDLSKKLQASQGYDTLAPDNATAKVASSEIYAVTPSYLPEARALASALDLPSSAVSATSPPPSSAPILPKELTNANLVLIIGPDLASQATAAAS